MSSQSGKPSGHHQQEMIDVRFFGGSEIFLCQRYGQLAVPLWHAFDRMEHAADAASFVLGRSTVVSAYLRRLKGQVDESCETLRIVAHEICDPRRDRDSSIASCLSIRLRAEKGAVYNPLEDHPANLHVDSWELLTDKHRRYRSGVYCLAPRFQFLKDEDWVILSSDGLVHPVAKHIPGGLAYQGEEQYGEFDIRYADARQTVRWRKYAGEFSDTECVSLEFPRACISPALTLFDERAFVSQVLLQRESEDSSWWLEHLECVA